MTRELGTRWTRPPAHIRRTELRAVPRHAIPERAPIGDSVSGWVVAADNNACALLIEPPPAHVRVVLSGLITLRYGLRFHGKPQLSIVPGLVAIDYGRMLTGEAAWEFLLRQSNLYPRAEVFGYRHDGRDEMMLVRALDLALAPHVLAYTTPADTTPAARVDALIGDGAALPERARPLLTPFASLDEWLAALP
jgi:hypothetical protein